MRYSKLLKPFTFLGDLLILNISLQLSHFVTVKFYSSDVDARNFGLLMNLTWILVAFGTRNYQFDRPLSLTRHFNKFITSLVYQLSLVLGIVYFFKIYEVSRVEMANTYLMFIVLMTMQRSAIFFALDFLRKNGFNIKHVVIIGSGEIMQRVVKSFANHTEYGYNFVKCIPALPKVTASAKILIDQVIASDAKEVFVCYDSLTPHLLKELINYGDNNNVKIKLVPDIVLGDGHAKIVNYNDFPVIQLSGHLEPSLKVVVFKRSFDIAFSLSVMTAGLPLFLLLALITKLTSRGPVFYGQERIGKNGKVIKIYKFRSMFVDAEKHGPQLSKDHDPRITKWGRIIRKSRLDELPQFINVLMGNMSVVGPRPERQYFIEQLLESSPSYKKLMRLKPGLTSIGQVNYGYAENLEQMRDRIRYDLIYLNNINFNSEMAIIFKTIKVMTQLKGK